jgi:hypothetical protein
MPVVINVMKKSQAKNRAPVTATSVLVSICAASATAPEGPQSRADTAQGGGNPKCAGDDMRRKNHLAPVLSRQPLSEELVGVEVVGADSPDLGSTGSYTSIGDGSGHSGPAGRRPSQGCSST